MQQTLTARAQMADDVIVVGAGPAGTIAAIVLARAGVRVTVLDRARFPREKLCGDTINPGTLAILRRLSLEPLASSGLPVDGMIVTAESGVRVEGRYAPGVQGRALRRSELDSDSSEPQWLPARAWKRECSSRPHS
jgi:2-polyprenyl-6-methoxyphenol hydroxylase-like FAD-dependent oxidoreductase